MNESTQARFQASSKTSFWLTGQLAALKQKVEESQSKVTAFERDSGLTGMTTPAIDKKGQASPSSLTATADNVPLERLLELNRDLTSAEVARIAKEAIYKMTESQNPEVVVGIGSSALASVVGPGSPLLPAARTWCSFNNFASSLLRSMFSSQLREQNTAPRVQS